MDPNKIEQLFKRYLQDQCSPEEIKLLFQYFDAEENKDLLKNLIKEELESVENIKTSAKIKERQEKIFQNIKNAINKSK